MEKSNKKFSFLKAIITGGAFVGMLVGSGLATGQEIMQYFVAYHYLGIASIAIMFVLLVYVNTSLITVGYEQQFEEPKNIYLYYGGKVFGTIFDYFSVVFLYMCFWVMVAGASALLNEQFGLPSWIGGSIVGLAAIVTLVFGFGRLVSIIGSIGPVVVVLAISLGIAGIMLNPSGLSTLAETVPPLVEEGKIMRIGNNWFLACLAQVGFNMVWLAVFTTNLGKGANSRKEATVGAVLGALFFSLSVLMITLGLMANVEDVAGMQIPNLIIALKISPVLGVIFTLIVFIKIYAASGPLLWAPVKRFAPDENSKRYRTILVVLGIIGIFIGIAIPFQSLINVLYSINGSIGFLLFFVMVVTDVRTRILKNHTPKIVTELQEAKARAASNSEAAK